MKKIELCSELLFGKLTRAFTQILTTSTIPDKKIYFFALLSSIVLAMILATANYFFGLIFILLLLIFVPFLKSLKALQKTKLAGVHLLIFEVILLVGLILHTHAEPLILPIGTLALLGFTLAPYFETETHGKLVTLDFDFRMLLFILSLAVNLGIVLLFFYAVMLNGQIILKLIQFEN